MRHADQDISAHEVSLDSCEPFGLVLEEGDQSRKKIENVLDQIKVTEEKLNSCEDISNEIAAEIGKDDAKSVTSTVLHRKKRLEEVKKTIESKKENVSSEILDLGEFLKDSNELEQWCSHFKVKGKEVDAVAQEAESVPIQLQQVEVILSWFITFLLFCHRPYYYNNFLFKLDIHFYYFHNSKP